MTFQNKNEGTKQVETTTIFKQSQSTQVKYEERMAQITGLLKYFNQNYVFEDKLRFNFLLHLFSSKLQDLYDNIDVNDAEFDKRITLLDESLKEITPYSL